MHGDDEDYLGDGGGEVDDDEQGKVLVSSEPGVQFHFQPKHLSDPITAKLQNLTTEGALLFIFVKSSGKTKEMQKMTTYVGNVEVSVSHHSNTPLNRGQPILRAKQIKIVS